MTEREYHFKKFQNICLNENANSEMASVIPTGDEGQCVSGIANIQIIV